MRTDRRRRRGVTAAAVLVLAGCVDDGPPAVASDVEVRASGCSLVDDVSSGIVVADGIVLTAAHGLRGAVAVTADGVPGAVVAVDHRIDAAIVAVPTTGRPVAFAADVAPGRARIDGRPVVVERLVVAAVDEPRDDTTYRRRALVIDGDVASGDSGSGVFGTDGRLLGMVFATSTRRESVAYAVAASELQPFVESVLSSEAGPIGPSLRSPATQAAC